MVSSSWIRWSGLPTALGGALWAGCAAVMASRPPGVPGGVYRQTGDLALLAVLAMLLIASGVVGLYARQAGRHRRLRVAGVVMQVGGVVLCVTGAIVGTSPDSPLVPLFIIGGLVAVIGGSLLSAILALQGGALPPWAGASLLVATLALLLFNSEDARAWWAVPFGLTWVGVGYVLWSGNSRAMPPDRAPALSA